MTLYARFRDVAAGAAHRLWHAMVWAGAVGPQDRIARRYHAFGAGTLMAFPPGDIFGEEHIALGSGTLIAADVSLSVGMAPRQPLPPGATSPVLHIGDRCSIGRGSHLVAHRSVVIGDDVMTGPHCYITDQNHVYADVETPVGQQWPSEDPVEIGSGSWLGAGAVILPGTRLGRNTVVAAGAVVRGDHPDHAVLAGVPAKVVRRYDPDRGWQPALRDLHIEPPEGWTGERVGSHPSDDKGGRVAEINGTFDERFAAVADVLSANLDRGADVGASACVVHDGRTVVDVWGGTIDDEGTPWAEDTIINVWSTTKTMTALTALLLADRGDLDLHAPVARYWPEFAANGKESVEVRHLLGHTAGLSGWQEPMTEADVCDWEKATSLLAAQAPWWEPGSASGYHALTQGYLVGEVIRRAAGGTTVGELFAKELAGPLGADFHIGTGPEHDARVALVIPPANGTLGGEELRSLGPDSIPVRTLSNPSLTADCSWTVPWRRAEIPAAGGHGNARSVARVQSILSHGGEVDGTRFLSRAGCEAVFEQQASGTDLVLQVPLTLGVGYGISSPETPIGPNEHTCFWGGWGGSVVINDLENRLTIAYVMNRMGEGTTGDDRGIGIAFAAYAAVVGATG